MISEAIIQNEFDLSKLNLNKIEKSVIQDWIDSNDSEKIAPSYQVTQFLVSLFKSATSPTDSIELTKCLFEADSFENILKITPTEETDNTNKDFSLALIHILEVVVTFNLELALKSSDLLSHTMRKLNDKLRSYSLHDHEYISSILKIDILLCSSTDVDHKNVESRRLSETVFTKGESLEIVMFDLKLLPPLIKLIEDSRILTERNGPTTDVNLQELSLLALGLLLRISDHLMNEKLQIKDTDTVDNKPALDVDVQTKLIQLLNNIRLENNGSEVNRVHSIGYFCFLVGELSPVFERDLNTAQLKRIRKGLSRFDEIISAESTFKEKLEKMIDQLP
ncbi:unnamed protein product [Ambrosiozyma monospora]|uniref:Unnamed protein product n=1 Tax=Ambrosiozyma monospora TaxID=43982 RepID=A0ACB5TNE4_AMBMO|nr:unnamed protein product [Ambrosiozyma monospora]